MGPGGLVDSRAKAALPFQKRVSWRQDGGISPERFTRLIIAMEDKMHTSSKQLNICSFKGSAGACLFARKCRRTYLPLAAMLLVMHLSELLFRFNLAFTELRHFVSIAASRRATPLTSMVLRGVVEIEHA
jgi:hypothetical protein